MGTVFKKTYTKPLAEGTEIVTRKNGRFAQWRDRNGRKRLAKVTTGRGGTPRMLVESGVYVAKYRDGSGRIVTVSTGCRDKSAALAVLSDLEARAEKVRAGVVTPAEDAVRDHQETALAQHIAEYVSYLRANGSTQGHCDDRERYLLRLSRDCRFGMLRDMDRTLLEGWLTARASEGMSARSRNAYRTAALAFCNWCVREKRLMANPFAGTPRANERVDRRRQRRALTADELQRLLAAAQQRPLLDRLKKNRGAGVANLTPTTRRRLERLGQERALIYKALVLTGLRKRELASLTVGQLELNGSRPYAELLPAGEKNRQGSRIMLRRDLAEDLRCWLDAKLKQRREEARAQGAPVPVHLPSATPLFTMPDKLVKILDRDLELAGIPKRDERGRTVDVHALRHTFATHLSKGGVPLRTAQAAMRHSDPRLTANTYTDPQLLDVAGALEVLPLLPLANDEGGKKEGEAAATTRTLAPMLAPNPGLACPLGGKTDKNAGKRGTRVGVRDAARKGNNDRGFHALTRDDKEEEWSGRPDLNRRPPAPKAGALTGLRYAPTR